MCRTGLLRLGLLMEEIRSFLFPFVDKKRRSREKIQYLHVRAMQSSWCNLPFRMRENCRKGVLETKGEEDVNGGKRQMEDGQQCPVIDRWKEGVASQYLQGPSFSFHVMSTPSSSSTPRSHPRCTFPKHAAENLPFTSCRKLTSNSNPLRSIFSHFFLIFFFFF